VPLRRFLGSNYDQDDPAYKHQSAQKRRERDGFLGVCGGMEGTNIDNRLAACVGDALVSKSHDPEKNESDPSMRYRFDRHRIYSFVCEPKWLIHLILPANAIRYRTNAIDPYRHESANHNYLDRPANQRVGTK
jgi:hypothetical protein